jgi:hypothetical protein
MIASQLRHPERRSMARVYALLGGGAIIILAAVGFLFRCRLGVQCAQPINLTAHLAMVKLFTANGAEAIVPLETNQSVSAGDKIDVDARGEALLHFPDFLDVRIFRNSQLALSTESSMSANTPTAYRLRLESGTIFNTVNSETAGGDRVTISTQWAEIRHIGTTFLVNYDPQTQRTWVVTVQGAVELRSTGTNGATSLVTVPAGWQSWVDPRKPPAPPVPATRPAVGTLFPPVDQLTNGAIPDSAVLAQATPTTTATFTATATTTATTTLTPTPTLTETQTWTPTATEVPPPAPPAVPTDTPPAVPTDTPTDTPTTLPTDTPTTSPTDTPTATATITVTDTPTNTPTPGPDSIRNLRVNVLSSKQVELTVDYTYASDHGDNVWIGAQPSENSLWFGYRPQQMVRGDGTATIIVTFGYNNSPPDTTTSDMTVYMYIGGQSVFHSQPFAYPLTWSLGQTPTPTDTPTNTPTTLPTDTPTPTPEVIIK